jgi:hypothetical protein
MPIKTKNEYIETTKKFQSIISEITNYNIYIIRALNAIRYETKNEEVEHFIDSFFTKLEINNYSIDLLIDEDLFVVKSKSSIKIPVSLVESFETVNFPSEVEKQNAFFLNQKIQVHSNS